MIKQSELKELLDYNPDTGIFIWKVKSTYKKIGDIAGYEAQDGYVRIKIKSIYYTAHKLAWIYSYNENPELIDHINLKKNDNRICNLRKATKSQNQYNKAIQKNNTSGIKGVNWNCNAKKWMAITTINGKNKNLGYFDDIALAEKTVIEARLKHHGEFARNK